MDFEIIHKNRQTLMGCAILWILIYHMGRIPGGYITTAVAGFGHLGVDIFLFLSSYGLCYSLSKNNSTKTFYIKRFLRIVPTWWFLLTLMFIRTYITNGPYPHTYIQVLSYYTGIGWWFRGLLDTEHLYYYEWYIPTLIAFYIVMPLLYRQKTRILFWIVLLSIIAGLGLSFLEVSRTLSYSYHRIPVFILGILYYRMEIKWLTTSKYEINKDRISRLVIISFCIGWAVCFVAAKLDTGNSNFAIAIVRCGFLLAIIGTLLLFAKIVKYAKLNKLFNFLGTITLELYILHIYGWSMDITDKFISQPFVSMIVASCACVFLAYLVNRIFKPLGRIQGVK